MPNTPVNENKMRQQSTGITLGHGLNATAKETQLKASSTIFRVFRSKHVADLRIIAAIAVCIIACYLMLAIIIFPTFWMLTPSDKLEWTKFFVTYFGTPVTLSATVIAWAYLAASKRLGIVDLFACEISTLCRVGTIVDIAGRYVDTYRQTAKGAAAASDKRARPSTDFVSQESYFPVFETNSKDLQVLEAQVVIDITAFYTYMKAARDTMRKLSTVTESAPNSFQLSERDKTLETLIKMLFLGFESGRKAVQNLIEYEPTRTDVTIMILITELKCYSFLLNTQESTRTLYARIKLREPNYKEIIDEIRNKVKENATQNGEWKKASVALPALEMRYREAQAAGRRGSSGTHISTSDRNYHRSKLWKLPKRRSQPFDVGHGVAPAS